MEQSRFYIEALVAKFQDGTLTDSEFDELVAWYNSHDDSFYEVPNYFASSMDEWSNRLKTRMNARLAAEKQPLSTVRRFRWLPYSAAAAILAVAVAWLLLDSRQQPADNRLVAEEILPGGNRATLTLADGRVVDLSSEQGGIVVSDGITYLDGSTVLGETTGLQSHTLTTPKGGMYSITLPDGSKAWLNSASRLKYPSRFNGNERVVEIEGEGYFEIVKDANRPFKVRSEGQEIEVVGTEFNIYAYADEAETQTTLVAGAVRILNLDAKIMHALRPGQQASTRGAATSIHEVNVERYAAWKNGYFDFTDMTLEEVMRQLGRWYDLEVRYEGDIPRMEFYGTIERSTRLSTVMALLESNGFAYRLDGRELIVWPKKGGAR